MIRSSRSKDYGGNRYGSSPYRAKPGASLSFQCRECRTIRYVTPRELARAARPRCLACGGTLIETDATAEKTMSVDHAANARIVNQSMPSKTGNIVCQGCGLRFRKNVGLREHMEQTAGCRELYESKEKIQRIGQSSCYMGTVTLRKDAKQIVVEALATDGTVHLLATFKHIYQAEEFVAPYTFSLKAARIEKWKDKPKPKTVQIGIRCPACHTKFTDSLGGSAERHLEYHLETNSYCRNIAASNSCRSS